MGKADAAKSIFLYVVVAAPTTWKDKVGHVLAGRFSNTNGKKDL